MGTDRLTPEEADMMLKIADKDGDKMVDKDEFYAIMTQKTFT